VNRPEHLPRTEADLEDWSVYADYLQTRDDPRGEAIALDVALPVGPTPEQLATFHLAMRPFVRRREESPVAWCVAHARTLSISKGIPKLLDEAIEFLAAPASRLLEQLNLAFSPSIDLARVDRLFAALPPTCRRVVLEPIDPARTAPDDLVARLPPHIREIAVTNDPLYRYAPEFVLRLISDRFDVVDLSRLACSREHFDLIAARTGETRSVTVRVQSHVRANIYRRCVLGRPHDAAVVDRTENIATVVPRWSWLRLQDRFGTLGVRTQLARAFTERHGELVRRGDTWTIHDQPIADGDRIPLRNAIVVLIAHDIDARARALIV